MPKFGYVRLRSSALLKYAFAILCFAVTFACVGLLGYLMQAAPPVSLFLCAIIFVAWFADLGPALLTTALSVLAFGYFYLLPEHSLILASRDLPRIILFGIAGVIIASVSAAQRRTAASLRHARDELQDANQHLKTINERLVIENRIATLGEMSASIAHEVVQSLTAIVAQGEANLRWLGRPSLEIEPVRRGVKQMICDAERASSVVNRIRALAQKNAPEKTLLDVNDVIHEVIKLVEREVRSHRVSLQLELADSLPSVLGDRVQLQQVVINMVINGIQAMDDIGDRAHSLLIRSTVGQSDQVVVSVQDSGNGIGAEDTNRLFQPFYTTKSQGTGMGLSICRSIIEAHGGLIGASNNSGMGATFYFALPSHRAPGRDTLPERAEG
jgi:C4-dicarboxylate-specific signal transduction histidine kinase